MKVEYIAGDGTRFGSEESCIQYERDLNAYKLYDRSCNNTRLIDNAFYIFLQTKDAIGTLNAIANEQGTDVDGIDDNGFFVYDEWEGDYKKIRYLQYRLDDIIGLMEQAKADYKKIFGKEYNENED